MTYARWRLWLGITGVGSLVMVALVALLRGVPSALFSTREVIGWVELCELTAAVGLLMAVLAPLDFLGGHWLPTKFRKVDQTIFDWLRVYLPAALTQGAIYISFGLLILLLGQAYGTIGGLLAIAFGMIACFAVRNRLLVRRRIKTSRIEEKLLDAIVELQSWEVFVPKTIVVKHRDIGFTGGVVGWGKSVRILIPEAWMSFSREQLATAIARRAIAINSGSYSLGLALAFAWNLIGFALCSQLPGAGFSNVAGLITTISGFTLWSFLGLLILPTISRNASLQVDSELVDRGMESRLIATTANSMDQMQDGEPDRPALIETIFHPIPNVSSRNSEHARRGLAAWNVARTTLFFSWACLGILSRSVHCNVGRPELWTMLPTD